nr:MAG TPA: hypothetical protein [Caudoviricetes sp.]
MFRVLHKLNKTPIDKQRDLCYNKYVIKRKESD